MTFPPRRVVVGHDPEGRPAIISDSVLENERRRREGHASYVVWATEQVPVKIAPGDPIAQIMERSLPRGTVFRIAQFSPGVSADAHKTDSVDYAVIVSGSIDLILETDTVRLNAGDVLVQQATTHNWVNTGDEPCVIAFCLVAADPA